MKAKKSLILFLVSCLCLTLCFGLSVGAEDGADKGGMETITLVSLIIGGVVLLGVIALCIVKRKKLVESLRAYKSEMKKITWFPWKSVWRCTLLVLTSIHFGRNWVFFISWIVCAPASVITRDKSCFR